MASTTEQLVAAKGHKEAEPHGWQVQDPFCHDKPHGEEKVGGRQEGEDEQAQARQYHRGLGAGAGPDAPIGQMKQNRVETDGGQVARITHRPDHRHRVHCPITAEIRGRQQQPCIQTEQVVVRQLTGRRVGHRRWIVKLGEDRQLGAHDAEAAQHEADAGNCEQR